MNAKRATSSSPVIKGIRRWFNLGLEEDQLADGRRMKQIELQFAKDNMAVMLPVSIGASIILLLLMLSRAQIHGYTALNTVPFIVGIIICLGCAVASKRVAKSPTGRGAVALVDLISVTWYCLAIFTNLVLQPDKPCVLLCLMFAAIPLLFDSSPKRVLPMTLLVFAAMAYTEYTLVPESVRHTDFNNAIIAAIIGVGCGRMKSAAKVKGQTYLEMFKTATKTTEVVAQIDLRRDTFEALQAPSSIAADLKSCESAHEMVQLISGVFIAPDFREEFGRFLNLDTLAQRMDEEKQLVFEHQGLDGRWHQTTVVEERRWKGKVSAVVVVVRDIDTVKRQELEYRNKLHEAAVEAKRANEAKSNFLRRMSHDIRTPINGIRGITKIGERYPCDIQKQTECRRKVIEASNYLTLLVDNILDMSKLESGVVELEEKPFNIQSILGDVAAIARAQASDHAVRFSVSADDANIPHPNLIGSPIHFQQILHNLCSNAVKYNRKGGSVSVRCHEVGNNGEVAWIGVEVSDTGLGMSEEFLTRAFEPFEQEQVGRLNGTYVGSGLGLSIVKEFTESMGGTINVSSEAGKGTTFSLRIPFKIDFNPPAAEDTLDSDVVLAGKHALVAEDNDLNREIIEFILEDQGLQVTLAENGEEALKAFAASEPGTFDVVLMDIMMPVMDGLDATRAIRALDRSDAGTVPILAMTANAFRDDAERSFEAGINEHLTKPLEVEKVVHSLQHWLR